MKSYWFDYLPSRKYPQLPYRLAQSSPWHHSADAERRRFVLDSAQ